jgi:hypothetical protein
MIQAVRVDLTADRWTPFVYTIDVTGLDLTSATMHAQVRLYPDAAGDPLIDLPLVTTGEDGVKFLSVDDSGPVPVSHLQLQIAAATLATMPEAAEIGNDQAFAWDIIINNARWLYGTFTARAGVTRNG